jgi:LPXTG-motif cell wall-anchored protein
MGKFSSFRLLALLCGGLVPVGLAAPAAAADPPGNNGTVKVDGVVFDDAPDNQPHVGCVFQVDFYGYDQGDLDASVKFQLVPPTAADTDIAVDDLSIGEDAAGGGTDLDASATYDLTSALTGVAHSQQGFHVRLTVHAEGSIGADTKFKEFWVTGCDTTTTTGPPTSSSTTSTTTHGGPTTTTTVESSTTVPGGSTTTTPTTAGTVPGGSGTTVPSASADGRLPSTGTNAGPIALAGATLAAIGAGAVLLGRRLLRDGAD